MSRSVNKVILVGNVGRDPDVRAASAGTKLAHVSLATSRRVSRNGEDFEERTEWHRVTLAHRLAQFAEDYVRRGQRLYVEGRLEYGSFERNGLTIPTAEIVAREILIVSDLRPTTTAVAHG